MSLMASQITSLTIIYLTAYWGADQRKHQSSASLAFVRGIHRRPVNSPHKWPVTRKMFPFDDVIMYFVITGITTTTTFTVSSDYKVFILITFRLPVCFKETSKISPFNTLGPWLNDIQKYAFASVIHEYMHIFYMATPHNNTSELSGERGVVIFGGWLMSTS